MERFLRRACLFAAVWLAGCSHPGSAPAPSGWEQVFLQPGDDLHQAVSDAGPNTVITLAEGEFWLSGHGSWDYGVLIQEKQGLTIRGQGRDKTVIRLPADLDFGFYIGSDIRGLTLERLSIEGTLPLEINTHAIGNYTGVGYTSEVREVCFQDLSIRNVAVGLSVATWHDQGVYDQVLITRNLISDTVGTESGWGYGIHCDNPSNVRIRRNFVRNATRHGIYFGRSGQGADILIDRNLVYEHDREGANPLRVASALVCARASDVRLAFNTVLNSRIYSMSVEPDDVFGWPTEDIILVGNRILGAGDGGLWVATGQTHSSLGNTIVQAASNPYPELRLELTDGSALAVPNGRWADADLVFDFIDSANDRAAILKNGVLDLLQPYTLESFADWGYASGEGDWGEARYLCSGPDPRNAARDILYIGLPGGGFQAVDPDTLGVIAGESSAEDLLRIEAVPAPGAWTADGTTEYRLDVILDCSRYPGREFFLAEWGLEVPAGFSLVRAELPLSEGAAADDFFQDRPTDPEDNRLDATLDADRRSTDNVRMVRDVFAGSSCRRGILGTYWFTVDPPLPDRGRGCELAGRHEPRRRAEPPDQGFPASHADGCRGRDGRRGAECPLEPAFARDRAGFALVDVLAASNDFAVFVEGNGLTVRNGTVVVSPW